MAISSVHIRHIARASWLIRRDYGFYRHTLGTVSVGRSLLQQKETSSVSIPRRMSHLYFSTTATGTPPQDENNLVDKRISQIQMNPKSLGQHILPGDYVIRTNPKTGKERKVFTDRAFGYFWMMKVRKEKKEWFLLSIFSATRATSYEL